MPTLHINRQEYAYDADDDTPLLWVIRDIIGLTGTKFGCGAGLCGACTVLLDGKATRSCVTPVSAVAGKAITTIEGLSENGEHPVQQAWIAQEVSQCGYCQPGFILSAVALLSTNAAPSEDDINKAFEGHICRCGTYPRIRKALEQAANLQRKKSDHDQT